MTDGYERRRDLVRELAADPRVEEIDWTRDGYRTVVLELGDGEAPETETIEESEE